MKNALFILLFLPFSPILGQTPNQILYKAHQQFARVKSFKSEVNIYFDLPSVSIENMSGKAFYKAPSKFRIRLKGIAFLPRDNPFNVYTLIRDSSQYASVLNGSEKVGNELCRIVSVIPNGESDIVMAKLWMGTTSNCPLKMQITSRESGIILIENTYGRQVQNALPDKMRFTVDMNKFKVPKALAADINNSPKKTAASAAKSKGTIEFAFTNYSLNTAIEDSVFKEEGK
ncbi:MAG: hypothetical protein DYG98_16645 [Haliscomenobacteraceae bacterium CHB4]|nr:hypothetical protein [Saprospiraceae bacterium]MCE7924678.1 hypothetical protein [Haliscomenobacteraceae bacterium CHB4]